MTTVVAKTRRALLWHVARWYVGHMVFWAFLAVGTWYAGTGFYKLDLWLLGTLFRVLAWGVVAIAAYNTGKLPFLVRQVLQLDLDEAARWDAKIAAYTNAQNEAMRPLEEALLKMRRKQGRE